MKSVKAILKEYDIAPRKALGQNFLSEMPTIEKIVRAVDPTDDECIVEIGPGLGVMTSMLARKARHVVAIDRDAKLLEIAMKEFADLDNVTWLESDILDVDLEEILCARGSCIVNRGSKIVGNLPYNISSPILFWILENRRLVSRAIIMVQKEVAERICAAPGGKDYGILSVQIQAYARTKKLFDVSPANFVPPPEVTSSVVEIDFTDESIEEPQDEATFKEVVRAAFGQRRKTIRNSLIGSGIERMSTANVDRALEASGIDPKRRPETLSVEEFKELASSLET